MKGWGWDSEQNRRAGLGAWVLPWARGQLAPPGTRPLLRGPVQGPRFP